MHHLDSWVKRKPTWCHLFYYFIQCSFNPQHVSAVNTTRYVEVQIQYFGDTITTGYTIHSITVRHHVSHTIEITLSNTAIHIRTNNALINNTLTQFLYTPYRYNPWNNNQLVAGSWRWSMLLLNLRALLFSVWRFLAGCVLLLYALISDGNIQGVRTKGIQKYMLML